MEKFTNPSIYKPEIEASYIYCPYPGASPNLKYNHDVDVIRFKGKFIAAWNANEENTEGVPGQYNFVATSDDFINWSPPERMFASENCINPISEDSQWQPIFINHNDEILFCAWCTHGVPKTYISRSYDGVKWENIEVPTAPESLHGRVLGFPTNHGLITENGTFIFPCSLPYTFKTDEADMILPQNGFHPGLKISHGGKEIPISVYGSAYLLAVRETEYAGLLISCDKGKTWHWSEPIKAAEWKDFGEKAEERGTIRPTIWEPMVFEEPEGRLGLIIRNSTTQDTPERPDKAHQMLFYCYSTDGGDSFTDAYPVEVDTVCSRCYAVSGKDVGGGLIMIHNDNWCRIPKVMSHDRYHLSMFVAPVPDPDLLLPGPVIQPKGGRCHYPNGFIYDNKLFFGASYQGIISGIIKELPDFSQPFLLPRESRNFLEEKDGIFNFGTRRCSLGLVLTKEMTECSSLKLSFKYNVKYYQEESYPVITVGGKSKEGFALYAYYSTEQKSDMICLKMSDVKIADICKISQHQWNDFEILMEEKSTIITVNGNKSKIEGCILRKISFGGLYEPPLWEQYLEQCNIMLLDKRSIIIEMNI